MVTISRSESGRLRSAEEDLANLRFQDRTEAALAVGEEELIPTEYVNRVLSIGSPQSVFREMRQLTQVQLADASGVNRVQIADIKARGELAHLKVSASQQNPAV